MKTVFIVLIAFSTVVTAQDQCGFPKSTQESGFESGEQSQFASLPPDSKPLSWVHF